MDTTRLASRGRDNRPLVSKVYENSPDLLESSLLSSCPGPVFISETRSKGAGYKTTQRSLALLCDVWVGTLDMYGFVSP